jgi:hypothetical protein
MDTLGFKLTTFLVLFILLSSGVKWIIERITGVNGLFGIGRFYAKLPPCRDDLGKVELGQLAENIDQLAEYLKDRSIARIGYSEALESVEYRLAGDLAELARSARNMKAFMDRNGSALLELLPLIIGRSAGPQRLLSAPQVQPMSAPQVQSASDLSPSEYRNYEAKKKVAPYSEP